jgi:hypothetical protein
MRRIVHLTLLCALSACNLNTREVRTDSEINMISSILERYDRQESEVRILDIFKSVDTISDIRAKAVSLGFDTEEDEKGMRLIYIEPAHALLKLEKRVIVRISHNGSRSVRVIFVGP